MNSQVIRRLAQRKVPMKAALWTVVSLVLVVPAWANAQTLATDDDKTFYAIGYSLGSSVNLFTPSKAEFEIIRRGLSDAAAKKKAAVDMQTQGPKIDSLMRARLKTVNEDFLKKAAKSPGAQKLGSGLVYASLKDGAGQSPASTDNVKVHYRGKLYDGTEFDSSHSRGAPAEFPLNGVIPCWTEGVQKMKVGGKARLVCPSDIAYGDAGRPPKIPPGATLDFEIELIEVIKATPAADGGAAKK
ncbi:MAG: FKBP-type peptidyl-prolyl cis-trans isomerase [Myxococcaceae bacterium]